ncbi:MAG TPA: recombination-associated protein RdgC [Rudaea sp.]|jgi:recombination associated protein RdgC|nr:recombination-associated protein RdgC [Rudaea sp.]
MWFRNLSLFRFSEKSARALKSLEDKLEPHRLRRVGPQEVSTSGFVSPYGGAEEALVHRTGQYVLVSVGRDERLLPNAVINQELAARLQKIEAKSGKRPSSKQRKQLKEDILADLLPRAFTRQSTVNAYFSLENGWLAVDSSSRKIAEDAVTKLRQALGTFPAVPMTAEESPRGLMTDWLIRGKLPSDLALADECELRDPVESGAIVRCRRQDLETDEVREHLKSGKQVFQLGLTFEDRMSFVLGEELTVRKLKFLDVVHEELDETSAESTIAELDARFALMTLELERLFGKLETWFGLPRPTDKT